jgi:hypothetical protein
MTNQEVAAAERVHPATVLKWRRRLTVNRLEGEEHQNPDRAGRSRLEGLSPLRHGDDWR